MFLSFDLETTGLDPWSPEFRVISCAYYVDENRKHVDFGEESVRESLAALLSDPKFIYLVYNASFEYLVLKLRLGLTLDLSRTIDVMRLVQLYGDARGQGWGLQAAVTRHLGVVDFKEPYYAWLRENVAECRGKSVGSFLSLLPRDLLEAYNLEDVKYTSQLYHKLEAVFIAQGFDFLMDHALYMVLVETVSEARGRGIRVDRQGLEGIPDAIDREIDAIDARFLALVGPQVLEVRKTLKIEKKKLAADGLMPFNLRSTVHMRKLFMDHLGLRPRFFTPKGNPSFKAAHLGQWGEAGKVLEKRSKRLKIKEHALKLSELSQADGRWHADLKIAGTVTGRMAGGSGE